MATKRSNNIGETRIIQKLVAETAKYHTAAKRRGRKTTHIALFWAIFDHHFMQQDIDEAFADALATHLKVSKPIIYTWNNQGLIPNKYRWGVQQFMQKYGIQLPAGISEDQLFSGSKAVDLKEEKGQVNTALFAHFSDVMKELDNDLMVLHEHLTRSNNLLNLSLLMRWIFEYGGIASTRVKSYMTAFIENPYLQRLRIEEYGFNTIEEGVEYAYRHGWVAPFERDKD